MKKIFIAFSFIWLTACSDPTPLKSNIEVQINELFGTEFGVIDQVIIQSGEQTLTVLNPEEFLTYLDNAEKITGKEEPKDITITLKTSKGMKEYSKEQSTEQLSFDPGENTLCNDRTCYKVSAKLTSFISTLK